MTTLYTCKADSGLTPEQAKAREDLTAALVAAPPVIVPEDKVPSIDAWFEELSTPEGAFCWNAADALSGEPGTPYYCDDCETYHSTQYAEEVGRDGQGRRWVVINEWDDDGNWDVRARYDEREGMAPEDWPDFYRWDLGILIAERELAWANYWEWSSINHVDPLCAAIGKTPDTAPDWATWALKNAQEAFKNYRFWWSEITK